MHIPTRFLNYIISLKPSLTCIVQVESDGKLLFPDILIEKTVNDGFKTTRL